MNITIVGGGFAGVKAALEVSKHPSANVTLISDKDIFLYYPALYSTATGHSHLESWVPLSVIFKNKPRVKVIHDTITEVDASKQVLTGESGAAYKYDRVLFALGTVTTYFGIKGLDKYAQGIKSAEEIKRLQRHLHDELTTRHTPDSHYVIVGGGPTGVELAAAMGAYLRRLCKKYNLENHPITIDLVEAAPRLLPRMSEQASALVAGRLAKLGVTIYTNTAVQSRTEGEIMMGDVSIKSHTVIWTSGVANHPFYAAHDKDFTFAPNGRVNVDGELKAANNIYVLGDNAATPYTGLAQTALHDAIFVARNLKRELSGKKPKTYKAVKPPVVVPVGPFWAIFEWHGLRLTGTLGAMLRRAADFMGYSDILPIGQALGVWRASRVYEDELPQK
jgi:NADH dehydrogenase FAD-containing subunit